VLLESEEIPMQLRYGVNPHQAARLSMPDGGPLRLLGGAPSYINVLDAVNAWQLVREATRALGEPAATSFKHVSPAGAALAGPLDQTMRECWDLGEVGPLTAAYVRARDCDPKSSFGDMIAVSGPVDAELADFLSHVVSDGIVAPSFEDGTVEILKRKKRGSFVVFECDADYAPPEWERRDVFGVVLEQETDRLPIGSDLLKLMAGEALTDQAVRDALLGMVALRYTQSNSVVYVKDGMTLGIGAGQQSRVDCTRLAGSKTEVWWLRRHPTVRELNLVGEVSRQDRLNWQIIVAQGEPTEGQRHALGVVVAPGTLAELTAADRAAWMAELDGVTVVHDGFVPFRDNIDVAKRYGARSVVEPGGSLRTPEVVAACGELGITLVHTDTRLFHH
jgi:phosphoribosylaminoimidazolecarboxamide formyltransferase/IMP cyclohydrolase